MSSAGAIVASGAIATSRVIEKNRLARLFQILGIADEWAWRLS
tara:strand:- start:108 stop:236 length:129 start_codon:yes stop_codon:yes gene_type:complete